MPAATEVDVAVVGAGLAGLCCARAVSAAGLHATVLEASDGVGGRVRTDVVDGLRLDRGFQILLTAYPEVARQLDVDALQLASFDPASLVWAGSGFDRVADPRRRPGAIFDTVRADVGSVADKGRVAWLYQRLVRAKPAELLAEPDRSTLDALHDAGFSDKMVERFFRPLVGGIQLDTELSTSARMFEIIFRTLAVGDAAVPALGMQAIPDQLAADLPAGVVRLSTPVERVDATTALLADGSRVRSRALVVATEGPVAAQLLGVRDPGSKAAGSLWFSAPEPPVAGRSIVLDGTGQGPVANLAVLSEVAPTYASGGRAVFVAACPGQVGPALEADALAQLRGWFSSAVDSWELVGVNRIRHGQPLADPPFDPKRSLSLGDGRYVTGDHRDTPSIQGAMFSGRRCGEAVAAELAAR